MMYEAKKPCSFFTFPATLSCVLNFNGYPYPDSKLDAIFRFPNQIRGKF